MKDKPVSIIVPLPGGGFTAHLSWWEWWEPIPPTRTVWGNMDPLPTFTCLELKARDVPVFYGESSFIAL